MKFSGLISMCATPFVWFSVRVRVRVRVRIRVGVRVRVRVDVHVCLAFSMAFSHGHEHLTEYCRHMCHICSGTPTIAFRIHVIIIIRNFGIPGF